ncbi:MAG: tRNA adenosine(34) deaminase TadA [Christensenellaceae bacterium]|nr:tRNA adenosine(34) deaminase TadA [Christensenellaceae bacterium]
MNDEKYMQIAIELAKKAAKKDEVPVGAVVVKNGKVIAKGYNRRERSADPSAHAEFIAMVKAAKKTGNWRLDDCTLYVTLEPCPMCAGLALNARLPRLVYGAPDPKSGAIESLHELNDGRYNHTMEVTGRVMQKECADILTGYFKAKRLKKEDEKRRKKNELQK